MTAEIFTRKTIYRPRLTRNFEIKDLLDSEELFADFKVTESYTLPSNPKTEWKHEKLLDFFRHQQLLRRLLRIMFVLNENMSDIWEEFNLEYNFHCIQQHHITNILQPYLRNKPSIAVFGPTNSGKTTMLNVLLGKWWLPEQETPNTDVVWRISFGQKALRRRMLVETGSELPGGSNWNIEQWMLNGKDDETALRKTEGGKEIFYELSLPNDLLSCGVDLWDTPSLNFDKWKTFERLILNRNNVIPIFMIDAQECLSEDRDVHFIKTMRRFHPDVPFMFALGRIDVSLEQLKMDHSFEMSMTLDSADEEQIAEEVTKCEEKRFKMQVPTAKFHQLILSTVELCAVSADKVWEELTSDGQKIFKYTEKFNVFIDLLLKYHGKRIERPFFRLYSRIQQSIISARSCLKILQDMDSEKDDFLTKAFTKNEEIASLAKQWKRAYEEIRVRYKRRLQNYLVGKVDLIYKNCKADKRDEHRWEESIGNYIVNVLISDAIKQANKETQGELSDNFRKSMKTCFAKFEGSSVWMDGIIATESLQLQNDFLWDRSFIQPATFRKYLVQLTTAFRQNVHRQQILRIIDSLDYKRIFSTVFSVYDSMDEDLQSLCALHDNSVQNISMTQELNKKNALGSELFPLLKSRILLLEFFSSVFEKFREAGMMYILDEKILSVEPFSPPGREQETVGYVVALQQRTEDIQKSLQFIIGDVSIKNTFFLKSVGSTFSSGKRIVVLFPKIGCSLYHCVKDEALRSWNPQQAIAVVSKLHKAMLYFQETRYYPSMKPDFGPQYIMLEMQEHEWHPRIALVGEANERKRYSDDEAAIHLPSDIRNWKPADLLAFQVAVAFWIMIIKGVISPPYHNPLYRTVKSWKYFIEQHAVDSSDLTDSIYEFFWKIFTSDCIAKELREVCNLEITYEKEKTIKALIYSKLPTLLDDVTADKPHSGVNETSSRIEFRSLTHKTYRQAKETQEKSQVVDFSDKY